MQQTVEKQENHNNRHFSDKYLPYKDSHVHIDNQSYQNEH